MADISFAIADAVKEQIDLVPFESAPALVVVRSSDVAHTTDDLPAIIVSVTEDMEGGWATTGDGILDFGNVGRSYVVTISIYRAFSGNSQTDVDDNTTMAKLIRQWLNKPFLDGMELVWDTDVSPIVTVNVSGLKEGTKKTMLNIRFKTCEGRNAE